ncbi:PHD and RING finger domain-containing protein 1 [Dendroctonus ponderosae]
MSTSGSERKRKVSEHSTSASSVDSDLDACSQSCQAKKLALSRPNKLLSAAAGPVQQEELSSDSENEEIEQCPICLKALTNQTLSITERCNHHAFCLSCLQEWSKTKRTCPVDRKQYQWILVLDDQGYVINQLPVVPVLNNFVARNWPTEPLCCELCEFNTPEEMLICDRCATVFHRYCRMPTMEPDTTPPGVWLCNDCWFYYHG